VISKAVSWVLKHQTLDGAFYEVTWLTDRKMNDSLMWPNVNMKYRNISLTAHVLIMLETVKDLTGVSYQAAVFRNKVIISVLVTVFHFGIVTISWVDYRQGLHW
jgi:hypothetical protein